MDRKLQEMIAQARRDLKRAAGLPLSPEEQLEERRKAELWQMNRFLTSKFDISQRLELGLKSDISSEGVVVGAFHVGGKDFHLVRKANKECALLLVDAAGNHQLASPPEDDPQFANKILVAIGDSLVTT